MNPFILDLENKRIFIFAWNRWIDFEHDPKGTWRFKVGRIAANDAYNLFRKLMNATTNMG